MTTTVRGILSAFREFPKSCNPPVKLTTTTSHENDHVFCLLLDASRLYYNLASFAP